MTAGCEREREMRIRMLLDECRSAAIEAEPGRSSSDPWEPTAADLEWICEHLDRRPTRDEWAHHGVPRVGGAHCADGGR